MDSTFILRLEALLSAQGVPPEERKDIVQTALLRMVYLGKAIRDPEAWILGEVEKLLAMWKGHHPENE
jgi:hypothetical protein